MFNFIQSSTGCKKDFVAIEEINPSLHFDSHPQEMERKQENPLSLQILSYML